MTIVTPKPNESDFQIIFNAQSIENHSLCDVKNGDSKIMENYNQIKKRSDTFMLSLLLCCKLALCYSVVPYLGFTRENQEQSIHYLIVYQRTRYSCILLIYYLAPVGLI